MFHPDFVEIQSMGLIPNYGYVKTPTKYLPRFNALELPTEVLSNQKFQNTVLWPCLFAVWSCWKFGLQGTGDCVSWMHSHMADLSDAIRNLFNPRRSELLPTASEATYAFGKCELHNNYRFHAPGMMGLDAILACEKFGRLLRKRYESDDLTNYNGELAELWGEQPRKTHGVPDYLEPEAAKHKMLNHLEVTDTNTAAAFVEAGYPVGYCGDSYWGIETDEFGHATRLSNGAHAMTITGVKYNGKTASHFWVANTGHGDHVDYRVKNSCIPETYRNCGSWMPANRIQPVLAAGDCFVISADGLWNVHRLLPDCTKPLNFA
jgi:hypothetical protein